MKNILIILTLAIALGAVSFIGTNGILRQIDKNKRNEIQTTHVSEENLTPQQSMLQNESNIRAAMSGSRSRQDKAVMGGGIGAAVGFFGGLVIVMYRDKKKKNES